MFVTIGETVSQFGNHLGYIARMTLVLAMTGRALDVGTVTLLSAVPAIVFGPVAGWLADRLPRKAIAVASNLLLAGVTLLLVQARTLPEIYALTFASAVVSSFFLPAKQAMVPSLVTREELVEMNAFNVVLQNIIQIAGPAGGGLIVGLLGFRAAFLVDAATFLFSAAMTGLVRYTQRFEEGARERARRKIGSELAEGIRFVWSNVALRYVFTFEFFLTLVMSMQGMLTILYVERYLGEPVASRVGLLFSMIGVGALLGGAATGWVLKRMGRVPLLLAALAFDGSVVLIFSQTTRFVPAMFLFVLLGIISAVFGVTAGTIIQEETPEEKRGRVYGLRGPILSPMQLLSIGGGTALAAWVGPRWVFFGAGLGEILLSAGGRISPAYRRVRSK